MLTNQGHRSAVVQALHAGVNEFLVKPTSAKALHDRLSSIVANPRPMVQLGDAYVPEPRKLASGLELDPPAEPWRV
jgi:DNA-binding response OmpR family regulator